MVYQALKIFAKDGKKDLHITCDNCIVIHATQTILQMSKVVIIYNYYFLHYYITTIFYIVYNMCNIITTMCNNNYYHAEILWVTCIVIT